MISGGVVPAGNCLSWVWEIAVICAIARSHIGVGLQEHLDDGNPIQRLRLDVLNVVDGCGQRVAR